MSTLDSLVIRAFSKRQKPESPPSPPPPAASRVLPAQEWPQPAPYPDRADDAGASSGRTGLKPVLQAQHEDSGENGDQTSVNHHDACCGDDVVPYTSVTLCDVTSAPATESACDESTTQRLYAIDDNETDRRLRGAMQEGLLRLLRQPGGQLDLRPSIWQIRSVHSGEGRTALTLALARVWSEAGLRVLMVDGDCDRAELTARIEPSPLAGWEQIGQSESASPSGKPWYSLDERLAVLPWCGTATRAGSGDPRTAPCATREDTSVIRQGPIAAGSLVRFMDSFDRILVDTAPGQQDWDTSVPASRVRALVVRDVRRTSAEELQAFLYHLAESGLEVVGCIDNFVNHEAQDTI